MSKTLTTVVLASLLVAAFALPGCSGASNASSGEPTPIELDSRFSESLSLTTDLNTVLVDDENCTITAVDAFETPSVLGYDLQVTNKRDTKVALRSVADTFTAAGQPADYNVYEELAPQASSNVILSLLKTDQIQTLDNLTDVHFQLELMDLSTVEQAALYNITL